MKQLRICIFAIGILFSTLAHSQIQDLATLADGKIVYSSVLFDSNDNLYGYLYVYERDSESQAKTMEYVFLDKNLNKVSNKTFSNSSFKKVYSQYYDCTLMGDYIILNKYYYYTTFFYKIAKPLLTTFQIISLKDNTVSADYKYENGKFTELVSDFDQMKTEYKGNDTRSMVSAFNNSLFKGFFITEDNSKNSYLEKDLLFFNEKKEKVWNYTYNPNGTENQYNTFRFISSSNNTIYISISKQREDFNGYLAVEEYKIVALDLLTGKQKYEYVLENKDSEFSHSVKVKDINNQLIITGNYSAYKKTDFNLNKNLGFYKIVLDEKGNELNKNYLKWSDFAEQLEISKKGRVKYNKRLLPIRYSIFKDGSISILTQKFKPIGLFANYPTYTDFVIFNIDANFKPKNVVTIDKKASDYSSGYLFAQYIKDDTGLVFFHQAYEKNSESGSQVMMYINTIIDGNVNQEKIALTARKKFSIDPYPAKEGYIMLREYNEKEKYNQLRLERLNY